MNYEALAVASVGSNLEEESRVISMLKGLYSWAFDGFVDSRKKLVILKLISICVDVLNPTPILVVY